MPHSYLLGGALEWDQDDRDKLMAFLLEQGDYCSMCGTHGWEWEEDPYAYEATISYCKGCAIKDMSQEEADKPGASVLLLPAAEAARLRAKPKQAPRRRDRG